MELTETAKDQGDFQDFKIISSLSVYQLGYLVYLFAKVGVIMNKNKTQLMKFFARFTKSKMQDNIRSKSLLRKMYNPEEGTKTKVKKILIDVINEINKR